jgi:hypothetical protein
MIPKSRTAEESIASGVEAGGARRRIGARLDPTQKLKSHQAQKPNRED